MSKLKTTELHTTTRIVTSEDGKKTFSFEKEFEGLKGKQGIFILLYPTRDAENSHTSDLTNVHLLTHSRELEMGSYRVINLFATVTQSRLSTRNLKVDEENLKYIEEQVFRKLDKDSVVVVAWGNSHMTSQAVNETKRRLLEMWKEIFPDKTLYQLTTDRIGKDNVGVHPLYMGIRHSNEVWKLGTYPYKKELKELTERLTKTQKEV